MGQGKVPKGRCWGLGLLPGVPHMMLFRKTPSAGLHLNHTRLNFSRDASRMRYFTQTGVEQDQQTKGALPMLPPSPLPSLLSSCALLQQDMKALGGGGERRDIAAIAPPAFIAQDQMPRAHSRLQSGRGWASTGHDALPPQQQGQKARQDVVQKYVMGG